MRRPPPGSACPSKLVRRHRVLEERIYAAGNALAKADLRILIASSIDAQPSGDRFEAFRPLSPLQPKSVLSGSRRRGLSEYLLAVGGGGLRTR
jgi:hypothetical protein